MALYDRQTKRDAFTHVLRSYDEFLDLANQPADKKLALMLTLCRLLDAAGTETEESEEDPWNLAALAENLDSLLSRFEFDRSLAPATNVDRFVAALLDAPSDTLAGNCL